MKTLNLLEMESLQGGNKADKCPLASFLMCAGFAAAETGIGAIIGGIGGAYFFDHCMGSDRG